MREFSQSNNCKRSIEGAKSSQVISLAKGPMKMVPGNESSACKAVVAGYWNQVCWCI